MPNTICVRKNTRLDLTKLYIINHKVNRTAKKRLKGGRPVEVSSGTSTRQETALRSSAVRNLRFCYNCTSEPHPGLYLLDTWSLKPARTSETCDGPSSFSETCNFESVR